MNTRVCKKCSEEKVLSEFPVLNGKKGWVAHRCRTCKAKRSYQDAVKNPSKVKNRTLKHKFGIDLATFEALLSAQQERCKICRQFETKVSPKTGLPQQLSVDHDHNTGQVRGLLCDICNTTLGKFNDDIGRFVAAAEYLIGGTLYG